MPDDDFDTDHEGHSGWTTSDFVSPPAWDSSRGNIRAWLRGYRPDIVLIESGTNDVFQCNNEDSIIAGFSKLILLLRRANPMVKIFVGLVPPLGPAWRYKQLCGNDRMYEQAIHSLNDKLCLFCEKFSERSSPILYVDQYVDIDPSVDMYDDIHPNTRGEQIMAGRWFRAIERSIPKLRL